jgi:3-hydroxybutyryl-CoA dehydrogenase
MTETFRIRTVGKIGLGVMGTNVAWACALNGIETYVYDQSPDQLQRALERLRGWFRDGRLSPMEAEAAIGRVHPCGSLEEAVRDVDFAFESVYEDLHVKSEVHARIGRAAHPRTLMGSNASSLPCTPLAQASGRPEKFFNMNFTDPQVEQLVEVMWNPMTSEETKRAAIRFARDIRMVPVVTHKEIMGYAFNRIWRAIKKEALFLVDRGHSDPESIDRAWMLIFGTPYGPFGLMDRIGLDTVRKIEMRYYDASGDERDLPPEILNRMVESGCLGEKSGKGFYSWPDPAFRQPGWLRMEPPWTSDEEV